MEKEKMEKEKKINRKSTKDLRAEFNRLWLNGQDNSVHAENIRTEIRLRAK